MHAKTQDSGSALVAEVQGTEQRLDQTPVLAPVSLRQGEPIGDAPQVVEELVIEEVSIDGMCGVY